MSVVDTLLAARAAGVRLRSEGDHLELRAAAPPPAAILERMACDKPAILALLRRVEAGRSVEMWHETFETWRLRAAAKGARDGSTAAAFALAACVAEWLDRNHVNSPPGRCLACDGGDRPLDEMVACGTASSGHVWLHRRCWPSWYAGWKKEARAALAAIGIALPDFAEDFARMRDT